LARRVSFDPAAAREILVRAPNWLGDLVMSTPGLRALRAACPGARITLWVREGLEGLLAGSPDVDREIVLRGPVRGPRALRAAARSASEQGSYDLGLCLPDSYSSALLMRAAGARPLVGYARGARGPLLDVSVSDAARRRAGGDVPREERVLGLLDAIGIEARDTTPSLATTPEGEARADAVFAGLEASGGRAPLVGLAPGAGYGPSKCWPAERFAAVGDAVAADGARVVLIGSPSEAPLCREVAEQMRAPVVDASGRLDVGALKAVMRRLSLLVGNDAGARHVAVAFGVPCIVLFGPTSVARTPLNLERSVVLERPVPCRPCYLRHCPVDHRCLREIGADEVIAAARSRLAAFTPPPAPAVVAPGSA